MSEHGFKLFEEKMNSVAEDSASALALWSKIEVIALMHGTKIVRYRP